jgi:hypothetical protein
LISDFVSGKKGRSEIVCFSSAAVEELSCLDEKFASRLFNLVEAFALDGLGPAQAFLNL